MGYEEEEEEEEEETHTNNMDVGELLNYQVSIFFTWITCYMLLILKFIRGFMPY